MAEEPASRAGGARRSTAARRIASLLDAAAATIDRDGVHALTTTGLAQEAGVSVGTVYRYYPDRLGVLAGLRERCALRLGERLDAALADVDGGWGAVVTATHGALVGAYREVPGFRAVASEAWLDADDELLARRITERGLAIVGAGVDERPPEALADALRALDALVRIAFERLREGDDALVDLALRIATRELRDPAVSVG